MAEPKIEVTPTRPLETPGPRATMRVVGTAIIVHFPHCMLKEPKPATLVGR